MELGDTNVFFFHKSTSRYKSMSLQSPSSAGLKVISEVTSYQKCLIITTDVRLISQPITKGVLLVDFPLSSLKSKEGLSLFKYTKISHRTIIVLKGVKVLLVQDEHHENF